MKKPTTIQIEQETLSKLKTFKIAKRESYDEILNRFMNRLQK